MLSQDRQRKGERSREVLLGDILAYKGKYKEAAKLYQASSNATRALNMYTDLRMFDLAQVILIFFNTFFLQKPYKSFGNVTYLLPTYRIFVPTNPKIMLYFIIHICINFLSELL